MSVLAGDSDAVRDAFAAWASAQPRAPRDPVTLVEAIEAGDRHLGLMRSDIEGRRVVWKSVPASIRSRITVPSIAIEHVDPSTADAAELRRRSDHVALYDECGGAKRVPCSACNGIGTTACRGCGGGGKTVGLTPRGSLRLRNCNACRGRGTLDCAHCRRGVATCRACSGEGRLQRWIELEWWQRTATTTRPDAVARHFGWTDDPSNARIERDAEVLLNVDRTHRLTADEIGAAPADWLAVLAPRLEPGERVMRQRLRIARADTHTVGYRLGSDEDRVTFAGKRLVAMPQEAPSALERRASSLRALTVLLVVVFAVIAVLAVAREAFSVSFATSLGLAAFGGALSMVYAAAAEWTGARRHLQRWLKIGAGCLAALLLTVYAMPRTAHARRLIEAGSRVCAEAIYVPLA